MSIKIVWPWEGYASVVECCICHGKATTSYAIDLCKIRAPLFPHCNSELCKLSVKASEVAYMSAYGYLPEKRFGNLTVKRSSGKMENNFQGVNWELCDRKRCIKVYENHYKTTFPYKKDGEYALMLNVRANLAQASPRTLFIEEVQEWNPTICIKCPAIPNGYSEEKARLFQQEFARYSCTI